jgi:NADH-quinone oxidoreductase subunit E
MSVRRLAPAEVQPASFVFSEENERWIEGQLAKYPEGRQASAVIPLLWQAQKQNGGWLPKPAIEAVAARLGMPIIRVMEVATFYTMFNLEPVGRWFIQLCGTVPCHVKGALDLKQVLLERVGDQQHVTADGNFSWLEVECLGACCNAPMVQINDDYYEDLTPDLLVKLLDDLAAGREVRPGPQNGRRASEPQDSVKTLQDPALYDGSLVGAWRKRFEQQDIRTPDEAVAAGEVKPPQSVPAAGEGAGTASGPNDPKPARPGAKRATQSPAADAPAQRAQDGKEPINPADRADASDPETRSGDATAPKSVAKAPRSEKSYTATPSRPRSGKAAAGPDGSPRAPASRSRRGTRHDGSETKPVGTDPDASPGVPPKEK